MLHAPATPKRRCGVSRDAEARAGGEGFVLGRARLLQHEVEADVHAVALAVGNWQQALARAEREIGRGKWIVAEVDLSRQRSIARRLNEEVHVRGSVSLAPERLHERFTGAARRAAVAARRFRVEGIAPVVAKLYAATIVERRLFSSRVEVRVEALGVGVPDVQDSVFDGLPLEPTNESGHAQSFGLVGVVRQIDVPLD